VTDPSTFLVEVLVKLADPPTIQAPWPTVWLRAVWDRHRNPTRKSVVVIRFFIRFEGYKV
jgi:hypothetical protein